MKFFVGIGRVVAAVALFALLSTQAYAQATRTWVSGVGDDANPCSRTAPCKTFAGAISKTAAAGTINVIDSAGFGGVTITKSITIEASPFLGGVLVSGTNAIIVNAAATDTVILRGLTIEGLNTGLSGIKLLAAKNLSIENCTINQFTAKGISLEPTTNAIVNITNTVIRNNLGVNSGGINIAPTATGSVQLSMNGVNLFRNQFGVLVNVRGTALIRDSMVTNSQTFGIKALTAGTGNAVATLDNVFASGNSGSAVFVDGLGAVGTLSRSTILNNSGGLTAANSGIINTFGDNRNLGNAAPGAPTQPVTPTQ
ncbi:MAG TPA: hypothetical protein VJ724_15075 [Tahibacter sp.]|nr:hypothetical protein [Tahibacter sp.]